MDAVPARERARVAPDLGILVAPFARVVPAVAAAARDQRIIDTCHHAPMQIEDKKREKKQIHTTYY